MFLNLIVFPLEKHPVSVIPTFLSLVLQSTAPQRWSSPYNLPWRHRGGAEV